MEKISDDRMIEFVRDFSNERNYAPTIRDFLSIGFKSTSHIFKRIDKLVDAGRLGRTPGIARSIYVKEA